MAKLKYSPGEVFGSWTLLSYAGRGRWLARCSCGVEYERFVDHLSSGKSSGCQSCRLKYRSSKGTFAIRDDPRTYRSWIGMRNRCIKTNNDRYKSYGGRGISVCDRWIDSFSNFVEDMGSRPDGTSLDRIDVNGNYEPSNCRWATPKEQMRNKRVHTTKPCVTELSERTGLPHCVLQSRLARGWDIDRATSEPVRRIENTLSARARSAGLKPGTVNSRIVRGWTIDKALSTPVRPVVADAILGAPQPSM